MQQKVSLLTQQKVFLNSKVLAKHFKASQAIIISITYSHHYYYHVHQT